MKAYHCGCIDCAEQGCYSCGCCGPDIEDDYQAGCRAGAYPAQARR